jgi:hypothetical protein
MDQIVGAKHVNRLNDDFHFGFKETRLIDELRQRYHHPQPVRYGRDQIPDFRLPAELAFTGSFPRPQRLVCPPWGGDSR